jgi:cAMP-dependent protein kinase regulator
MPSWTQSLSIDDLIAGKKYDRAIEQLEAALDKDPKNVRLRLQLGDVLTAHGKKDRAATVLLGLVDQLASDGFVPKAIVVLKKVQKLSPSHSGIEERLVDLCQSSDGQTIARRSGIVPSVATAAPSPAPIAPAPAVRSPLFGDFSRDELLDVVRGLKLLSFEPGAILVTEGEKGDSLLVLTSGSVRCFVKNPEGRNVQVRQLAEGEFFGEISLLSGSSRTATVTAASSCELLELDRPTFDDIVRRHPRVRTVVEEFYNRRVGSDSERLARASG